MTQRRGTLRDPVRQLTLVHGNVGRTLDSVGLEGLFVRGRNRRRTPRDPPNAPTPGRPLGDEDFVMKLEEEMKRSLSPQRGGRPAKTSEDPAQTQLMFES